MSVTIVKTKKCGGCKSVTMGAEWPVWAKLLRSLRHDSDRGVGDTAERLFGLFGTEQFKRWHVEVFGTPCRSECPKEWNARFPYEQQPIT